MGATLNGRALFCLWPLRGRLQSAFHRSGRLASKAARGHDDRVMEAVVIIVVPLIAMLIAGWAIVAPRPVDRVAEQAQMNQHIAWLEERLAHARQKNWDEQMMANLLAQLDAARRKQGALQAA
jgi:hypothetical protein